MTKTTMIVDGCSPAGARIRVYLNEFDDGRVQVKTFIREADAADDSPWHCCNATAALAPVYPLCRVEESYEIVRDIEEHGVGSL